MTASGSSQETATFQNSMVILIISLQTGSMSFRFFSYLFKARPTSPLMLFSLSVVFQRRSFGVMYPALLRAFDDKDYIGLL